MLTGVVVVLSVVALLGAAASAWSLWRHRGTMPDRRSVRRLGRTLDRGRLPADEPDRTLARGLAGVRADDWGNLVMLLALGAVQLVVAPTVDGGARWFLTGVAVLLLLGAVRSAAQIVASRWALRQDGRRADAELDLGASPSNGSVPRR